MNFDLEALSLPELNSLLIAAERRKQLVSSRRPIAVVRRKAIALAAQLGYTIEELYGDQPAAEAAGKKRAPRRKTGKVAAKYRDPENKRNTWSGRGRMPRWLAQKTKHGRSATDFLIPGLAKPTARKSSSIGQRKLIKQG
ncbi:H-NS histone family protein [Lysobacter sp. 5GHs7-4]|uniref:H-NS histone family protein n=1 Tax=Lysobacter sp. 5GHs7-4 TaxID=2904253 RepID=UPI001E49D85E|nr:H-NS histone family protein [Lysobacter sp. 5GHs7-4]UHQ23066.1 H-NS histone family protein [Lysobacter sp. 5GHs7-4]